MGISVLTSFWRVGRVGSFCPHLDGLQGSRIRTDFLKLYHWLSEERRVVLCLCMNKINKKKIAFVMGEQVEDGETDCMVKSSYTLPCIRSTSRIPVAKLFRSSLLSLFLKYHLRFLIVLCKTHKIFYCST